MDLSYRLSSSRLKIFCVDMPFRNMPLRFDLLAGDFVKDSTTDNKLNTGLCLLVGIASNLQALIPKHRIERIDYDQSVGEQAFST